MLVPDNNAYESDPGLSQGTGKPKGQKWGDIKFVFGWDQPLMSFYLQMHDAFASDPDENPVVWLGATRETQMYEVEDLVRVAQRHDLVIDQELQTKLYGEKDDGK